MTHPATRILFGLGLLATVTHCDQRTATEQASSALLASDTTVASRSKPAASDAQVPVLDVSTTYPATDLIGAKRRIRLSKTAPSEAHSPPEGWKIEFDKQGSFAGVCWKNRAGNEGDSPGDNLSAARYRRISFWAKGAKGGEVVEFRAGGLGHIKTRYRDSFDVTAGQVKLTTSWSEHSIYVKDVDLSSVMTVFCALLHQEDNAEGAAIFLDDIQYRG
jgi:hypothetical protein